MLIELENAIKSKGYKKKKIAENLGISPSSFSAKLHEKSPIYAAESLALMDILEIEFNQENYKRLFFVDKVHSECT